MRDLWVGKRIIFVSLIVFIFTLLIEIFVFNARFFQSVAYAEKPFGIENTMEIRNAHLINDGLIELDEGCDSFSLIIGAVDMPINNIRIDAEIVDEGFSQDCEDHVCNIKVSVRDEALYEDMGTDGNTYLLSSLYKRQEKRVLHVNSDSQYIWMENYGTVSEIQVDISSLSGEGRVFRINDITFNARKEMKISWLRITAVWFCLNIIFLFLFERKLWNADCTTPAKWKIILPVVIFMVIGGVAFAWPACNQAVRNAGLNEYAVLADSLMHGKVSVGEAGELVKGMENEIVFWNSYSGEVKFDYAYYNGKYYVYFGILPCLVFFLPYRLLTGHDMPNYIPVVSLCLTLLLEIYLLLGMLIRRYFRNVPYMAKLLMTMSACGGMGIPFFISVPDHYMIAILSGVVLCIAGGMCWLRGCVPVTTHQLSERSRAREQVIYLTLGSVCMAAVSLCRPTLLILGFMFLASMLITGRDAVLNMPKAQLVKTILAVGTPYVLFAVICMYYNYIRFDSVFDFGASKNMTTIPFNGNHGYLPYQIARSLYEYLVAPANFTPEFPFFYHQHWKQLSEGSSILAVTKPDIGLFTGAPVLWAGLFCFGFRKRLKEKKIWYGLISILICAFILIIFDTRFTFCITDRYTIEFSFIFFLWAYIGIMELWELMKEKDHDLLCVVFFFINALLLLAFFYGALQIIPEKFPYNLSYGNTELYYRIYYLGNFML